MGLLLDKIAFEYPAPRAVAIADAATKECGLKVCVEHLERDEYRDFSANLYFEGFSEYVVEVYTYRQGAIRKLEDKMEHESGHKSPIQCQGYDDADGIQRIYFRSFLEAENTLFEVLTLAARKLDGCLEEGEPESGEELPTLTSEIMASRHEQFHKEQKKRLPGYIAYGALTLITSPFWILWMVIKMPFDLLKIRRENPELFAKPQSRTRRRS